MISLSYQYFMSVFYGSYLTKIEIFIA